MYVCFCVCLSTIEQTQWNEVLTVMESALVANSLACVSLATGSADKREKAVGHFLSTPTCRVLLINVKTVRQYLHTCVFCFLNRKQKHLVTCVVLTNSLLVLSF
jgi:hypothetical protein